MAKNLILKVGIKGAKKTTGALKSVGSAVTSIGIKAGIATAGFGAFSTKLAGDFQKSLLEVSTLLEKTTNRDLDKMSKELRAVAMSSGVALDSLAKAKYDIVSAGFSSVADSAEVLRVSSDLAVGGVTSVAEAADLLTTSLNALGLDASNTTKVADQLFTTVRLGKTTMTELSASLGQVLPFARSAGLGLDGVGAAMATLTASGINTAQATTSLRATLVSLQSPAESSKKAMAKAGIEIKRFDDGTLDLVSTIKQFQGIDPDTLKKIIPRVEAILGIQTMAQNFTTLTDNVEEFASKSEGATEKAFNKMSSGFNQQMSMLKNSIQSVMIEIGNVIIEIIQPKIEEVNKEFATLGEIGFDNLGSAVKDSLPVIMNAFKQVMFTAFETIEDRAGLMGLTIKEHLSDAIPFIDGDFKKIEEISESLKLKSKNDADFIAQVFKNMYGTIKFFAEQRANDDFDLNDAIVENFEQSANAKAEISESELNLRKAQNEEIKILPVEIKEAEALTNEERLSAREEFSALSNELFLNDADQQKLLLSDQLKRFRLAGVEEERIRKLTSERIKQIKADEITFNANATSQLIGGLQQLNTASKGSALVSKRLAQVQAVIDTFAGANKALASAPPPFNFALAAAVTATGLANVMKIESQSFAQGGIVQGVNTGQGDTVPAMLTPGEVILNQAQQENLAGGMGGVTVNIQGDFLGSEEQADRLANIIEDRARLGFNRISTNA
jgi:TP901 family phage tail tape measure protein